MYAKAFLIHLIKAWENIKKEKKNREKMEKLENITKWNGSTEYEVEKVKQSR